MKKYIAILMLMMCIPLVLVGCADKQPDSTDQFSAEEVSVIVAEFRTDFIDIYGIDLDDEHLVAKENEQGTLVVTLDLSEDYSDARFEDAMSLVTENLQLEYPNLSFEMQLDEPFAYVYIIKT